MSAERDKMVAVLKATVVPVLKARGFKGSFPHFRRPTGSAIHLLTFQFDKWGGGFVVEIAKCPPEGVTTTWGLEIPPGKVTAHHVNERLRLGASGAGEDHWFRYDQERAFKFGDPYQSAAEEVLLAYDSQAEQWWAQ
jgi:hypothetical protein